MMQMSFDPLKLSAAAIALTVIGAGCTGRSMESSAVSSIAGPTSVARHVSSGNATVDVCHTRGNGAFELLSINSNALAAHLGHGDGQPLGTAPDGDVFTSSCDRIASVAGVWEGEFISFDPGGGCGRDVNLMRLTLTQSGSDVAGTMYWKILESFYPPDVGMEQTVPIGSGGVSGNTFTFTFGPAAATATFTATTMSGTVAYGSGCPANTFTLTRQ